MRKFLIGGNMWKEEKNINEQSVWGYKSWLNANNIYALYLPLIMIQMDKRTIILQLRECFLFYTYNDMIESEKE